MGVAVRWPPQLMDVCMGGQTGQPPGYTKKCRQSIWLLPTSCRCSWGTGTQMDQGMPSFYTCSPIISASCLELQMQFAKLPNPPLSTALWTWDLSPGLLGWGWQSPHSASPLCLHHLPFLFAPSSRTCPVSAKLSGFSAWSFHSSVAGF